ncbi:hypothetical protein D1159_02450 [Pseudoflavonifractor sp. 524-17]|uniref:PepSY domain-containing protein n=1 Tax=Pseudoflavonifractor sp. 524-17 TaxID=2304577 RepID=UPI00137A0BB5|nr:PepSY domain-containing protein [Pseudoflavonifractor sp. 524-17]NCE63468.1 hypothetical protein [Pseudoflavonifractor sp. 524-17]
MKQINWKKSIGTLVLAGALTAGTAAATAAVVRQKVTAELRPDITLKVNGQAQNLDKAPLSYNGTTYLPVRAVGEMVGMKVDWDGKSQTVSLTGQTGTSTAAPTTPAGLISVDRAKEIALKDAGLRGDEVTFLKNKLDREDGRQIYEIDFYTSQTKHNYDIDAVTGEIRKHEMENWNQNTGNASGDIGLDQAKAIAAEHIGVPLSQLTIRKAEADWDNGRKEYEIEVYHGTTEYEFTIDAATGAILDVDMER